MWIRTFRRETDRALALLSFCCQILKKWDHNSVKGNRIKLGQKDLNVLTGSCDLQGFQLVWNQMSHCRLFIETLPLEMFWLEKMKLVKWLTLEWREMCNRKTFMKGKLRYVLYWKLALFIMSLLSWFHALRVAPKTVAHEVTALCVKLIKRLTSLTKHKRLFCRSPERGIR